eukprot:3723790-Karenia_brevis.AAC.1
MEETLAGKKDLASDATKTKSGTPAGGHAAATSSTPLGESMAEVPKDGNSPEGVPLKGGKFGKGKGKKKGKGPPWRFFKGRKGKGKSKGK